MAIDERQSRDRQPGDCQGQLFERVECAEDFRDDDNQHPQDRRGDEDGSLPGPELRCVSRRPAQFLNHEQEKRQS